MNIKGTRSLLHGVVVLTFLGVMCTVVRGDIVFLNDGSELVGRVLSMDRESVLIDRQGREESLGLDKVLKVRFVRRLGVPGEATASGVRHPVLRAFLDDPPPPDAFPESGYVTVLREVDFELRPDGSSSKTVRVAKYLLKERGLDQANVTVSYLPPRQEAQVLFARSIVGDQIHALDDTSLRDAATFTRFPDYDRHRSNKFAIPNAAEGGLIDYSYRITTSRHDVFLPFADSFSFQSTEPQLNVSIAVRIPPGVTLDWFSQDLPQQPEVKQGDEGTTLLVQLRDLPGRVPEPNMAPWWMDRPSLHIAAGHTWETVGSTLRDAVLAAAATLPEDVQEDIAARAREFDGRDLVARLTEYLHRRVSYVPVAARFYSIEPRPLQEVFRTGQGNPLDKSVALWAMLEYLGVPADLVYVVDEMAARFMDDVPSVLAALGAVVWLPQVGFVVPYEDTYVPGMIPSHLQGTRGYQVTGRQGFVELPHQESTTEETRIRRVILLDEQGNAEVDELIETTGSEQRSYRWFKDIPASRRHRAMERLVGLRDSKAVLDSFSLDNLDDPYQPVVVDLRYRIDDAVSTGGPDLRLFELPGIRIGDASVVAQSQRTSLLHFTGPLRHDYTFHIMAPPGFVLYHQPVDLVVTIPHATFDARWTVTDDGVNLRYRYERLAGQIAPEDYADFRDGIARIREYLRQPVVFERR